MQKYFQEMCRLIVLGLMLWPFVVMASHTLNPGCANVVLDPSGLGGSTETFDGCLLVGAGSPSVGVILMHGRTSSPDGPVVNELRNSLNAAGYTTLSIENPSSDPTDDTAREFADYLADAQSASPYAFPEAYARVQAAINHLQGLGVSQVVLAGFSMGSRFATAAAARIASPSLPIIGLIGVGMYNTSGVDPLDHDSTLKETGMPVLDIFGDDDTDAESGRLGRVSSYSISGGSSYTQVMMDCAAGLSTNDCHKLVGYKGGNDQPLETVVNDWMACNAPLGVADCSNVFDLTWDGTLLGPVATVGGGGTTDGGSTNGGGGGGGSLGSVLLLCLGLLWVFSGKEPLSSIKITK
ncbi:MAG TPA: DUF3530 family protein [Gammaproteobacteria bacterium]|nr:DUF3530 family protein [Gammaproteobacteria bacterium]